MLGGLLGGVLGGVGLDGGGVVSVCCGVTVVGGAAGDATVDIVVDELVVVEVEVLLKDGVSYMIKSFLPCSAPVILTPFGSTWKAP